MAAASLADVDGLSYAFGADAYMDYHHVLGHNAAFAVGIAVIFTFIATPAHRIVIFVLCLTLAHLHLVLDYFGEWNFTTTLRAPDDALHQKRSFVAQASLVIGIGTDGGAPGMRSVARLGSACRREQTRTKSLRPGTLSSSFLLGRSIL